VTSQTPDQIATKWATAMGNARGNIEAGVNAVSVAPGQAAANAKAAYVAGVQANSDKFAANSLAVTLPEWKSATITKGLDRIGPGATAAQPKMTAFMGKLIPYQKAGIGSLPARGTLDQNQQRMIAWMRYMAAFKK